MLSCPDAIPGPEASRTQFGLMFYRCLGLIIPGPFRRSVPDRCASLTRPRSSWTWPIGYGSNSVLAMQRRRITARNHPDFHISGCEKFMKAALVRSFPQKIGTITHQGLRFSFHPPVRRWIYKNVQSQQF